MEAFRSCIEEVVFGAVAVGQELVDALEPIDIVTIRVELRSEDLCDGFAVGSAALSEDLLYLNLCIGNVLAILVGCGSLEFRNYALNVQVVVNN